MIIETSPGLQDFIDDNTSIRDLKYDIQHMIHGKIRSHSFGYVLAQSFKYNDEIYDLIREEIALCKITGIGLFKPSYIDQYMDCIDAMAKELLFYFLVLYDDDMQKHLELKNELDRLYFTVCNEVKAHRKNHSSDNSISINDRDALSNLTVIYAQFLHKQAFFREVDLIIESLQKDNKENPPVNQTSDSAQISDINDPYTDPEAFLSEGKKIHDYKKKINEVEKLISLAHEHGNNRNIDDPLKFKVLFVEIFVNRLKYQRKQARTIVREILEYKTADSQYLMFLDQKFIRGFFRELDMLPAYDTYAQTTILLHKILMQAYQEIDYEKACGLIASICGDFLGILSHVMQIPIE